MQMLIFVLNNVNYLEDIMNEFTKSGIKGATIIDSTGMAKVLHHCDPNEIPLFGSLKMLMNEKRPFNKTIFTVIRDDQVQTAVNSIKNVVGDLSKPDVGIVFTIPINFVEGIVTE
jgi:nitrogen regulatory protein PII